MARKRKFRSMFFLRFEFPAKSYQQRYFHYFVKIGSHSFQRDIVFHGKKAEDRTSQKIAASLFFNPLSLPCPSFILVSLSLFLPLFNTSLFLSFTCLCFFHLSHSPLHHSFLPPSLFYFSLSLPPSYSLFLRVSPCTSYCTRIRRPLRIVFISLRIHCSKFYPIALLLVGKLS